MQTAYRKKDIFARYWRTLAYKPFINQNFVLPIEDIQDLYNLFNLYADSTRHVDLREIMNTARILGFNQSHSYIYEGLIEVVENLNGEFITFEEFITLLTNRLGHSGNYEGRRQVFYLIDRQAEERLTFFELKKIAKMLRYTLTDDQIEEIITRVAGKGQREISWQQFNDYLDRHVNKKNSRFE